jgi:hypothetical protein
MLQDDGGVQLLAGPAVEITLRRHPRLQSVRLKTWADCE